MFVAKVLENQNILLLKDGRVVREFESGETPGKARELLSRINQIRDFEGTPIYAKYFWKSYPLWALHQEELFNVYCRPFAAFRTFFEYIEEHGIKVEQCEDTLLSSLSGLITLWNKAGVPESARRQLLKQFRSGAIYSIKRVLYSVVCWLTVLKTQWNKTQLGLFSYDTLWGKQKIDRRLKDVYAHLSQTKLPYIEIFPALTLGTLANLLRRKRLALYYPPAKHREPFLRFSYELNGLSPIEQKFAKAVIPLVEMRMDEDRQSIPGFIRILKKLRLKKVFSVDDSWTSTPLIVACKELGLELVGMQHGYFCKYHAGHLQNDIPKEYTLGYPKLLVWGESSKEFLVHNSHVYSPESLIVAGYIRPLPKQLPRGPRESGKFRILYPFEFLSNSKDVAQYINAFIEKGYEVTFKVRWDTSLDMQLAGLPKEKINLVYDLNETALRNFDVCAGTSTSFLHEMYYLGVPIWYLETRSDYLDSIVTQGFGKLITLDMLKGPDFDPHAHLITPQKSEYLYAPSCFFDWIHT